MRALLQHSVYLALIRLIVSEKLRGILADEGHCYAWHKRVLIINVQCLANLIYFVLSVTSS